MKLLALTISFLMLLAVITISQSSQMIHSAYTQRIYKSYCENTQSLQIARETSFFHDIRLQSPEREDVIDKPKPKPRPKNEPKKRYSLSIEFDCDRIPDNARLNLALLTKDHSKKPQELTLYEITASFLRQVYGKQSFFLAIPDAEYKLLDRLIEQNKFTEKFSTPDELATIDLGDEELQKIFYFLLKGAPSFNSETPGFPSLLYSITFDPTAKGNRSKINLLFASESILLAIFKNQTIVENISAMQKEFLEKMFYYEEHRKELPFEKRLLRRDLAVEIEKAFEAIGKKYGLDIENYKKLFDYKVGHMGHYLIINDLSTGLTLRQYIPSKKRLSRN